MKQLFSILLIFAFFAALQVTTGCANVIPPQGGPRDSLPPVLLNATPKDSTVNFRGNRIVLNFDEFVDLQEVQGNLLFTPLFENTPVVEARLRTITIRLRDSLEANTTYTFDFGNALRDINEGNVYRNFAYRFSTGSYLDSLELSGRVVDAETGKIDTTMIVVLHRSFDDSAVYKTRPRYVSRVDRDGGFRFRSLPRDSFAIYAIGDAGIMRRYTNPAQAFGFANGAVYSSQDSIQLYSYKEAAETTTSRSTGATTGGTNTPADRRLRFTSSGSQQDLLQDFTLTFERPLRQFDSTRVSLAADSTFTPVTGYRWLQDSTRRELSLRTQWQPNRQYHLILQQNFAADTLGRQLLKADTVSFTTRRLAEYGAINLELTGVDTTQNPVLQFVQSDKVVYSVPIRTGRFTQQLFLPGDYDLRLLNDRNGNGRWDAGQFFGQRRQPEIARPFTQKITIRADRENDLSLPAPR